MTRSYVQANQATCSIFGRAMANNRAEKATPATLASTTSTMPSATWPCTDTMPDGCDGLNCWDDKVGGWPSLEQGPVLPEEWDHVIQLKGGGATGDEVAFDGHAWLVRDPDGHLHWVSVSS
jgi:hypothetical protein